jgi:dTDP-4-dehydrorhamnose reductase
MKILILGANGMIGQTMFKVLSQRMEWKVVGSIRSNKIESGFDNPLIYTGTDLSNSDQLMTLFNRVKPDVVVNCAGLTKHLSAGNDPVSALTMNALLPNRLVQLCAMVNARLIHISTDCVFSGIAGNYCESELPDATDIYGKTKALGEVNGQNILTIRTSTIGHENGTKHGLLEWFLAQKQCKGYQRAIFSGLPTVELARVVRDVVIPNITLSGLYHVGAEPINKLSLLQLIANVYQVNIKIVPDETVQIDRSLNSQKFADATGYRAASWSELVKSMYQDYLSQKQNYV